MFYAKNHFIQRTWFVLTFYDSLNTHTCIYMRLINSKCGKMEGPCNICTKCIYLNEIKCALVRATDLCKRKIWISDPWELVRSESVCALLGTCKIRQFLLRRGTQTHRDIYFNLRLTCMVTDNSSPVYYWYISAPPHICSHLQQQYMTKHGECHIWLDFIMWLMFGRCILFNAKGWV